MRSINLCGDINNSLFESRLKRSTQEKTLSRLFSGNVFLCALDKGRKKIQVVKTGEFGIGGGQLYFRGTYTQQDGCTVLSGKFQLSAMQIVVSYGVFLLPFIFVMFQLNSLVAAVSGAIIYHLVLCILYKLHNKLSLIIFQGRYDAVETLLKNILDAAQ